MRAVIRIGTNREITAVKNPVLAIGTAAAFVLAVASFASDSSAQTKKAAKAPAKAPAACSTIKAEAACKARSDCSWTPATKRLKITVRRARCVAAAPAPAPKAKTPAKKK